MANSRTTSPHLFRTNVLRALALGPTAESSRRRCSPRRGAGGRDAVIEALNLAPDFFEELVSNSLFDTLSGGVIRVEPFCQIALERSIPEVADILTTSIVAGFGGSFE